MNQKSNTSFVKYHQNCFSKQNGVVLFIALIALVVMSLAAVALIRSVDTNAIIAGNLGFKQSATVSADSGVETAISWLASNQGVVTSDSASNGYYATSTGDFKALVDASTAVATGAGVTAGRDSSGNLTNYIIQRMCNLGGAADPAHCLYGPPNDPSGSYRQCEPNCLPDDLGSSIVYRVTVRVLGPKNTVSYTQAFVY